IVKVVGHATRQTPGGLHLLRMAKLLLELSAPGNVPTDALDLGRLPISLDEPSSQVHTRPAILFGDDFHFVGAVSFLTGFLKHLASEGGAFWRQDLGEIHLKGIDKVAPNHSPTRSVQGAEIAFQVAGKNH